MNADPVKQAWQASVAIAGAPPLEEVRAGADKFYRAIRRRNLVEYAACAFVVVVFTFLAFTQPHILQRVGDGLIVLATLYVAWQLHRRASAEPPERAGAMPIYAFLRAQLVRQRDALKGIFWWYMLPFMPGFALSTAGNWLEPTEMPPGGPGLWQWLSLAGMVALLAGIWWINQVGARKLQRHIDEIDALTEGSIEP